MSGENEDEKAINFTELPEYVQRQVFDGIYGRGITWKVVKFEENPGGKIRTLREGKSWPQQELASRAGITLDRVKLAESDFRRADFETVRTICLALGITMEELLFKGKFLEEKK